MLRSLSKKTNKKACRSSARTNGMQYKGGKAALNDLIVPILIIMIHRNSHHYKMTDVITPCRSLTNQQFINL